MSVVKRVDGVIQLTTVILQYANVGQEVWKVAQSMKIAIQHAKP